MTDKKPFVQYTDPFVDWNSWKVAFHSDRISDILCCEKNGYRSGFFPAPVYVTVDPTDVCNHDCVFCISGKIRDSDNTTLKRELLLSLVDVLYKWMDDEERCVNAVVIAGGGEPLVNKNTLDFMRKLGNTEMQFALITNGELMNDDHREILASKASWAGISVDAGDQDSHSAIHQSKNPNSFAVVIDNIYKLCKARDLSSGNKLDICYKFLIHPNNFKTIELAAGIARDIGCNQIRFVPASVDNPLIFTHEIIEESLRLITHAREMYESDTFKVHGVIHKMDNNWKGNHDFGVCTMTPLGAVFSADGTIQLCCDRRGDDSLRLGKWHDDKVARLDYIYELWGSEKHLKMIKAINVNDCPRCAYYFYNKLAQEVFVKGKMNRNFL